MNKYEVMFYGGIFGEMVTLGVLNFISAESIIARVILAVSMISFIYAGPKVRELEIKKHDEKRK